MLTACRAQTAVLVVSLGLSFGATGRADISGRDRVTGRTTVSWETLSAPIQERLARTGLDAERFPAWLDATRARTAARVREGDEDHLVFYALQSTRFTTLPPIEPASSASALVRGLDSRQRASFLADGATLTRDRVPADVRARLSALARSLTKPTTDARQRYFQELMRAPVPLTDSTSARDAQDTYLARVYLRAMRFLHDQATAARTANPSRAVAALYRTRGLSTDTAVEATYLVQVGLATLHALDRSKRFHRIVIVGPGLDLAPRTGLLESEPPQSYQPYAVADALLSVGAADEASLAITCLDVNPRVVAHLARARSEGRSLTLVSGVAETDRVSLADGYRDYFAALGRSIGSATARPPLVDRQGEHLRKSVRVRDRVRKAIDAVSLDVVSERAELAADLVVVTNVLAYFDDRELTLALSNLATMLAPGGVLIHNEARPEVGEIGAALRLPLVQSRTAIIATVRGASPLYDSVFMHQRS
jgi:SAM-dependent methyltransferase